MKKQNKKQVAVAVSGAAAVASLLTLGQAIQDTAPTQGKVEAGRVIQTGGVWGGG